MPWQATNGNISVQLFNLAAPVSIASPGAFTGLNLLPIPQYNGFDLSITAHCPTQGIAGAAVSLEVILQWFSDPLGANLVYQEKWYPWVGNSATSQRMIGSGPMHGLYMSVFVGNEFGNQPISLDGLSITGTSDAHPYTSFRQIVPGITINGATMGSADGNGFIDSFDNFLGSLPTFTPGVGLQFYPMPIYAGPVKLFWQVATAILLNVATLIDMTQTSSGALVPGTGQPGFMQALSNTINTPQDLNLIFPRKPIALVINPAATSQITFSLTAQQGY